MRIYIDIETQGLQARKFILGVICFENLKTEVYNKKEEMYNRILELAEKERDKGRQLVCYAHSMEYEYIGIGAFDDLRNVVFCPHPLIADHYVENERGELVSGMKWIDNMGIWRGSLETLGEAIGEPKTPMPEWLKLNEYTPNFQEINEITEYCKQDTIVLATFIEKLRKKLWKEGIRPRVMYTIGQIAISYFLKKLRQHEYTLNPNPVDEYSPEKGRYVKRGDYLDDIDGCSFYTTKYTPEILESYRLGRVQAFQTGECPSVHMNDINSLFPYASTKIPYPKLNSEKKIQNPLSLYTQKQLFSQIGVSRCHVLTPKEEKLGYLAVRQYKEDRNEYTHYPETQDGEQHLLVGTWTHLELTRALALGYEIQAVEWSVVWEEIANPLEPIISELYHLRKDSGEKFDDAFYKLLLNNIFGKLAQRRPNKELIRIDREELPEYTAEGWEPLYEWGTDVLIVKEHGVDYKRYYAPIIATYITAWSRDYLYTHLQQIPRDKLWYCATDSIVWDSIYSARDIFKYGENLGQWKREHTAEPLLVYGRQAYAIGDTVKLSRVPKKDVTLTDFYAGHITYTDIRRMHNTKEKELVGTQVTHERELSEEEPIELPHILIDTRIDLDESVFSQLEAYSRTKE